MDWRPYAACCHREALQTDTAFCPECGRLLLRCPAFAECMSLVAPLSACPVCVAPELAVEKGAVLQSKVGERLSIPLVIRNASKVARPLWVKFVVKREGKAEDKIELTWEELAPQSERGLTLETAPLAEGGTHTVGVIATIASRTKTQEEQYAFSASIKLTVESREQQNIVQNINLSGAQFETGGMVHAPISSRKMGDSSAPVALRTREPLAFGRAERYELETGIRGYSDTSLRVPRNVAFSFTGFPESDHPGEGATMGSRGALSFGRNSRQFNAETNPLPNDVALRFYNPRSSQLDDESTRALSRHHFDLVVLNDRLCVQARSSNGLELNGKRLAPGEVKVLRSGDKIAPLPKHPEKLLLTLRFHSSIGTVDRVEIAREPPVRK